MLDAVHVLDLFGVGNCIAARLEDAPKGRELWENCMAGFACKAGLTRIARNGEGAIR